MSKKFFRTHRGIKVYILSAIIGCIVSLLCLFVLSVVTWALKLSVELADTFALISLSVGALTSGIFTGKLVRNNGMASGLGSALLLLIPIIIGALITGNLTGAIFLSRLTAVSICGAVGGVIGVNTVK